MKKYILIAIVAVSVLACNRAELESANNQRDSMEAVVNEKDSLLNEVLTSFNEIKTNLDSVAFKQHIITVNTNNTSEFKQSSKEYINSQIAGINELMDQSRKKINDLNKQLKRSGTKNAMLVKTIAYLNDELALKDHELAELNTKLLAANTQLTQFQSSINTLTAENTVQAQDIADKTTALHTVYYVVGTTKELEKANLIDRQGGLLGIGKTSKLSTDFDKSKFTSIDYTQTNSIEIGSKNIKIVTTHAADCYILKMDDTDKKMIRSLVITDAEKFWSASKYLVIVKD